jgi:hypothetical protein
MTTILICFFHAIGKVPNSLAPVLYLTNMDELTYGTYLFSTNIITWLCQSMNLILYILFNQEFRKKFQILILKSKNNQVSNVTRTNTDLSEYN